MEKRFHLDKKNIDSMKAKISQIRDMVEEQRQLTELLRQSNKKVSNDELRDAGSDSIEFAKNQTNIALSYANLISDLMSNFSDSFGTVIYHLNILDGDISSLKKSIDPVLLKHNEISILVKYRKLFAWGVIISAVATVVTAIVKKGFWGE